MSVLPELPDLKPEQIPGFISSDEELRRWKTCVGITREITGRDDWQFATELYQGDIPTDPPDGETDEKAEQ